MRASGGRVQGTHGTVLAKSRGCGAPAQGYGQVSWARDGQTDASARGDRIEIAQDPAPTRPPWSAKPCHGPRFLSDSVVDHRSRPAAKRQKATKHGRTAHTSHPTGRPLRDPYSPGGPVDRPFRVWRIVCTRLLRTLERQNSGPMSGPDRRDTRLARPVPDPVAAPGASPSFRTGRVSGTVHSTETDSQRRGLSFSDSLSTLSLSVSAREAVSKLSLSPGEAHLQSAVVREDHVHNRGPLLRRAIDHALATPVFEWPEALAGRLALSDLARLRRRRRRDWRRSRRRRCVIDVLVQLDIVELLCSYCRLVLHWSVVCERCLVWLG